MAPTPARVPLAFALLSISGLSGCLDADPTFGLVPRAPIGNGSGQLVASFERSPSHTYGAPGGMLVPRAPIGGVGTGYGGQAYGGTGSGGTSRVARAAAPSTPAPAPVYTEPTYSQPARMASAPMRSAAAEPAPAESYEPMRSEPLAAPITDGGTGEEPAYDGSQAPLYQQQQAAYEPPPASAAAMGLRQVQFLPIVGAPADSVSQLAQALARNAPASSVEIVAASAGAAPTQLKGYLSAMTENGQTSVIYVWDVLDASGNRINRIQGQEPATGRAAGDAWSAVGPDTMEAIAKKTLAEVARSAG